MLLVSLMTHAADSVDDDFLNMELDGIFDETSDDNGSVFDTKISDYVTSEVVVKHKQKFVYNFLNDTMLNDGNRFDINTYSYNVYTDILAGINFGSYFKVYVDNSFRFVREGNELTSPIVSRDSYQLIEYDHEDIYKQELENIVREGYLLWNIPTQFPLKITMGRAFSNPGTSYVFNLFNSLHYKKTITGNFMGSDDVGVNMLKFSAFFPMVNFDIIYSPGFPDTNDTTEFFSIQKEQRFFGKVDVKLDYVDFSLNGYVDTALYWSVGSTIAVDVNDNLILYNDLVLNGKDKYKRLVKQSDKLFGDMCKYNWEEFERIGFKGVLFGMNYSHQSAVDIIAEVYFNSNGINPFEQKELFSNLKNVNKYYKSPETLVIPSGLPSTVEESLKQTKEYQKESGT